MRDLLPLCVALHAFAPSTTAAQPPAEGVASEHPAFDIDAFGKRRVLDQIG
jgi:hypothetical protein